MTPFAEFYGYLAGQFADADLFDLTDEQAAVAGVTLRKRAAYMKVLAQGRVLLATPSLDWQRIGGNANRDFKGEAEARAWLTRMMNLLEGELETL